MFRELVLAVCCLAAVAGGCADPEDVRACLEENQDAIADEDTMATGLLSSLECIAKAAQEDSDSPPDTIHGIDRDLFLSLFQGPTSQIAPILDKQKRVVGAVDFEPNVVKRGEPFVVGVGVKDTYVSQMDRVQLKSVRTGQIFEVAEFPGSEGALWVEQLSMPSGFDLGDDAFKVAFGKGDSALAQGTIEFTVTK